MYKNQRFELEDGEYNSPFFQKEGTLVI